MPEAEVLDYHGLKIRIRSDDEELLKETKYLAMEVFSMLEFKSSRFENSEIEITINDDAFRFKCMSEFEYVNFDLVLDASNLPDIVKFYMKVFGDIKPVSSENRITTFHFTFDERGDKARIYDSYKMCDIDPCWMIHRAIKDKDNKFIKWAISSYRDYMKEYRYLRCAIRFDNAEAFHLFEQIAKDIIEDDLHWPKYLIEDAESYKRPEYAEYIRNHYLE